MDTSSLLSPVTSASKFRFCSSSRWTKIAAVACFLLCLRIEFFRQISVYSECASSGSYAVSSHSPLSRMPANHIKYTIPFYIALYDYFCEQRYRSVEKYVPAEEQPVNITLRLLYKFARRSRHFVLKSRQRFLISAGLVSLGGLFLSTLYSGRTSTYICPSVSILSSRIPAFQSASTVIDIVLLIAITEISREWTSSSGERRRTISNQCGCLLLGVTFLWTAIGLVLSRYNAFGGITFFLRSNYVNSIVGQGILMTGFLLSAFELLPHYGVAGLSIVAGFVSLYSTTTATLSDGQHPFPMIQPSNAVLAYVMLCSGVVLFVYARATNEEETKFLHRYNTIIRLSFVVLLAFGAIFGAVQPRIAKVHPIDLLIFRGRVQHSNYASQARSSESLDEAVQEYKKRYAIAPPPGFDEWYRYATKRKSAIIDDFDQIYEDLLPFRALPPQRLRQLTHDIITNPFNSMGGISIRGGKPRVQEGIMPTHVWMVQAAAQMIEKFSEHLPDMDLAFNLDDQPRVAVPYEDISVMRDVAKSQHQPTGEEELNGWSTNREMSWAPIEPPHQTDETVFGDFAWHDITNDFTNRMCPPSSKVRSSRIWDRKELCLGCLRPHSMGQFPSDWNLAMEICHQPDLAMLHGFLSGPTSFKTSRELVPVFSQSTVSGFNDILYPSPWNYVGKAKYDPSDEFPDVPYEQKNNTLSWIGSTSEGVSHEGSWKGMARQRFVHLINNNKLGKVSVLLPAEEPGTYTYELIDGTSPSKDLNLQTNVHLNEPITHCDECETEQAEMGTVPAVNFQSNWGSRYLFDLDGAGFSGRFLPFLKSHSLPWKTGLFRQWFDPRITAWLHFVPIDIRLHGVWSTLAYFAGVDGIIPERRGPFFGGHQPERKIFMPPHDVQGKWIAEEGRNWAQKVLRKEDMEIYFFRLLLEWGRLTDDHRDVLGFDLKGPHANPNGNGNGNGHGPR